MLSKGLSLVPNSIFREPKSYSGQQISNGQSLKDEQHPQIFLFSFFLPPVQAYEQYWVSLPLAPDR